MDKTAASGSLVFLIVSESKWHTGEFALHRCYLSSSAVSLEQRSWKLEIFSLLNLFLDKLVNLYVTN